jgi:hypothetical protein
VRLFRRVFGMPRAGYDALTDVFLVPMAGELIFELEAWSDPVQIRVRANSNAPGDVELEVRRWSPDGPPTPADPELEGLIPE